MPEGHPADCRWPALAEPYRSALEEAAAFVFSRTDPVGIIAAGSIVRGTPGPSSDLDLVVVREGVGRQAIYRYFAGVPAEVFISGPGRLERDFRAEAALGAPFLAHMVATGFVVYARDETVDRLRAAAREVLVRGPEPSPSALLEMRFGAANLLEDALDILTVDDEMCRALLTRVVEEAVRYRFWSAGRWQPRHKEALRALEELDPVLGRLVRRFYRTAALPDQIALAREIAQTSLGATGFFEWESELEGE